MKNHALVILMLALVMLTGCSEKPEIMVGTIYPLTGPAAGLGEALQAGTEWKLSELSEEGREIGLVIEDSASDPGTAVTAYNKLVNVNDIDIVFTSLSGVSMTLKPLAEEQSVLLWSVAAHPDLTKNSNHIIRHSNTVEEDARVISSHIKNMNNQNVGIIYQQDDWGVSLKEALETEFSGVKTSSVAVNHRGNDFKTEVFRIKQGDPDTVIVITVGSSSGIILKQLRELGYEGDIYSSIGFILTPGAEDLAGSAAEGMYYHTYEENFQFKEDFEARYGKQPPTFAMIGYTNIELLDYAIKETGSSDPTAIRDHILKMGTFKGKYETVEITPTGDLIIPTTIEKWQTVN